MKKAQSLLEYTLIVALVALAGYMFAAKFDLQTLMDYVFNRPADTTTPSQINIEAMTK